MLTDFGKRHSELVAMAKVELAEEIVAHCGMWTEPRNRTKQQLIGVIKLMESHRYDKDGQRKQK